MEIIVTRHQRSPQNLKPFMEQASQFHAGTFLSKFEPAEAVIAICWESGIVSEASLFFFVEDILQ